ncbi:MULTISPECIES: penicillin-binding transpeptidase domain-containing protein [unclassified Rhodococcus (in: high G+C Gram-positive bacteria)]|uniref:penicillin-binding transpeptidase domain-containing protein n=1 Tax=unclassified Rhodococcus (in: high G+C Gram-positive bacteria) TaxID=192944 RepID=UPI00163997AE|nr:MULTISPECIES: penicillin-binding transpeptidase domain-containing protein [unclassified Rhodococcus (in: high G+C Gram-positive bacteria)]MBC2643776.1 penicillin-binding transpeptidase domain-containing protein [Rhodococcus sp. 3A]MBC2891483.1 penicillin-binding transpeptidase domain-containing protein [Rhodococcus sp. 4CII]
MNLRPHPRFRVLQSIALCGATVLTIGLTACTPRPDGPEPAAQAFLTAFAEQDSEEAANLSDRPDAARQTLESAWTSLQAESLDARTTDVHVSGDTATVGYTYEWHLPKNRVWTYSGELQMGRRGGDWAVRWSSTNVHPRLGDRQTMSLRSTAAPRARVNEHSGSDVLVPGVVYRVKFDAAQSGNVIGSAQALASALAVFDNTLTAQSIAESATAVKGDYLVTRLRSDDYEQVAGVLAAVPGVTVSDEADLVATDRNFAPDLVGQVKKTVIDEVDGKAGWSVVTVNQNGVDTDVLTETAPQTSPSFSISLDRPIQIAAQNAVNARTDQTMMVVIQPSTGDVLAVAQNKAADRDGPVALTGLYPPGSTFKIITAGAAISSGLATPDTMVPCPGRIEIGERSVPNYNEFALGTVPMATAFARSCNTSFAKLASEMRPDALTVAASQYGIGPDYDVVGLPTDSGSVPPADDLVQRTEDGFGQGKVVVSPFGMALAAATIAHGSTPVPRLIAGRETTIDGDRPQISPEMVDGLRGMMRLVVTSGTAERIEDQGEVYGKTGEAEVEGGSHAWFVGYRGDLAFATLVVRGGSSDNAVAVTRDMFAALPEGY